MVITLEPDIGEAGKTTVYVRKRNPAIDTDRYDRDTPVHRDLRAAARTSAARCAGWMPPSASSAPATAACTTCSAVRVGGPPVRPLDRFYTRVVGDQVQVGPRFSVNSELRRFSPRDPGEPLDGIGQYLYPSRPGAQKL